MFARNVSLRLKPNTPFSQFTEKFEHDVLPLLRKQNGFQHEVTMINSAGTDVTAISIWDQRQNAEAYDRTAYPEVLKLLSPIIEGSPSVVLSEVGSSTSNKNTAKTATA
jgi:hypothetical protein